MTIKLYTGDVLKCLAKMPDESVQCVVTSPPYWGLRDYGTATWKGGDPACDHKAGSNYGEKSDTNRGAIRGGPFRDICRKCGARRIDDQIGLEPTPEAFVANMVAVFAEVRRVLRPDGTCWVNLGDSYAQGKSGSYSQAAGNAGDGVYGRRRKRMNGSDGEEFYDRDVPPGLKPKDLVGIPWRVAFALQADGWYLRSDIIWHKPNPMPESVRDRPTKAHEYVFLLTKRARYYYDADALREEAAFDGRHDEHYKGGPKDMACGPHRRWVVSPDGSRTRNSRSVWTITPKPFKGAHFATFPPALVERCVKAGTSERGACPHCGKPWERVTETSYEKSGSGTTGFARSAIEPNGRTNGTGMAGKPKLNRIDTTTGWLPACTCPAAEPVPCTVLDPFSGAGTVALVSDQLGRDAIGIDLNPAYNRMARKRISLATRNEIPARRDCPLPTIA